MIEEWKDIPGYEGRYQASNLGRIKSLPFKISQTFKAKNQSMKEGVLCSRVATIKGKIKKQTIGSHGYFICNLGLNDPQLVHRLVALAFIENPNNLPCIDHKNSNKTDNRIQNLEWVTFAENTQRWWSYRKSNGKIHQDHKTD